MLKHIYLSRTPEIHISIGLIDTLGTVMLRYGTKALVIMGKHLTSNNIYSDKINDSISKAGISPCFETSTGEPSPETVDSIVDTYRDKDIDVVCAIGGGSIIDTGKAVSAMLRENDSVLTYLEGVGTAQEHSGRKIPFIAVPTTAGTGSEATKNAVLSRIGADGFKKSLRHDNFVPDIALIDPGLALSCPQSVTASSGMDALCQLIESYVSIKASPMTDALALSGINYAARSLVPVSTDRGDDINLRSDMAYAALCSGITLANAGLGVVHGFASSIGGSFDIAHGVICGTLLAESTRVSIEKCLIHNSPENNTALEKYAHISDILTGKKLTDRDSSLNELITNLYDWSEKLSMPRLGDYGITRDDIDRIVALTSPKNNPGALDKIDMSVILAKRL